MPRPGMASGAMCSESVRVQSWVFCTLRMGLVVVNSSFRLGVKLGQVVLGLLDSRRAHAQGVASGAFGHLEAALVRPDFQPGTAGDRFCRGRPAGLYLVPFIIAG